MPNLVTLFNNEKKKFTDVQSQEPITDGKTPAKTYKRNGRAILFSPLFYYSSLDMNSNGYINQILSVEVSKNLNIDQISQILTIFISFS